MIKYFYTNRLDAFYMEQKWGVRYKGRIGEFEVNVTTKSGIITINDHLRLSDKWPVIMAFIPEPDEPNEKWVVHEDSVNLFEPQVGDLISYKAHDNRIYYDVLFDKSDIVYKKDMQPNKIIQRNNMAFIMPEAEHD